MRKLALIVSALAIVLGLAQCQKRPNAPVFHGGERQTITFTTGNGGGAKGDFEQLNEVLNYKWTEDDKIYVYASPDGIFEEDHGSSFCGVLDFESCKQEADGSYTGVFTNTIAMPYSNGKVMFVHYGQNVTVDSGTGAASVSFAEQNGNLTGDNSVSSKVIASCVTDYSPDGIYDNLLTVEFAVVSFSFEEFAKKDEITLSNISNNGVRVDKYGKREYTGGTTSKLKNVNTNYYTVFMPESGKVTLDFRNEIEGAQIDANKIEAGIFYTKEGAGAPIPLKLDVVTTDAISGMFSVDDDDTKVYFAKGNVQYQPSTKTWRMAEHQYDYVGNSEYGNVYADGDKCDNHQISEDYTGWIDLLGWATSGKPHTTPIPGVGETYQPYFCESVDSYYVAYNSASNNIYDGDGSADWGVNFSTAETKWFTPKAAQWEHLLYSRTTANGQASTFKYNGETYKDCRYAQAKVDGVCGLLLFPDIFRWTEEMGEVPEFNQVVGFDSAKSYTLENFAALESAGVAFIPASGFRYFETYTYPGGYGPFNYIHFPNQICDYWTSDMYDGTFAKIFQCMSTIVRIYQHERCHGFAIRLVTEVPVTSANGSIGDFTVEPW